MSGAVDRKKRKMATCMWRPVSTQSSSVDEHLIKDDKSEDGRQLEGGHSQEVKKVMEATTEKTNLTVTPSSTEENIKDETLEGTSLHPAEKHSLSIEVGSSLMRFIKGKGYKMHCIDLSTYQRLYTKQIEEDMDVKIIFPLSKKDDSIGVLLDNVTNASKAIQAMVTEAVNRHSLDCSHFVSLPLANHTDLINKLVNFQKTILGETEFSLDENLESDSNEDNSDNQDKDQELNKGYNVAVELKVEDDKQVKVDLSSIRLVSYTPKVKSNSLSDLGIVKSIFIKPKTFHLTVLMLKLWNKECVNAAAEVLKSISSKVMDALDHRPVFVKLKGLDCMKGTLAKARVLYATMEEIGSEDRLIRACNVIIDAFTQAGLVLEKDAKQKLKLHATVMNARHRKGKRSQKHDSFDARSIFKQFGLEDWGDYLIREAHLSQRFVFDENGCYHCCASIPFPESTRVD